VLIDIDSLRADRVGSHARGNTSAPNLSRLAQQGAHFDKLIAQANWTLPSLQALLLGRYPNQVAQNSLAGILSIYGYDTAVFWGGTTPAQFGTFSHGFDEVYHGQDQSWTECATSISTWLKQAEPPFFLLAHNIDLHFPPTASLPEEDWSLGEGVAPSLTPSLDHYYEVLLQKGESQESAREHALALYERTIASADEVVASIVQALDEAGLAQETVLVITSNHGEDLFEHGFLGHGKTHFDSVLAVPLVWLDPALSSPIRQERPVRGIDLAPSILQRASIPADASMDGRSFLSLLGLSDASYEVDAIISHSGPGAASLRTSGHKLAIHARITARERELLLATIGSARESPHHPMGSLTTLELYDLLEDPGETRDISALEPQRSQQMRQRLLSWIARRSTAERREYTPEQRELLQRRGYWQQAR